MCRSSWPGWAARSAALDRPRAGDTVNIGWALLSMKRRYRGGRQMTVALEIDDRDRPRRFELRLRPRRLEVLERSAENAQLTIRGKLPAIRELLFVEGTDPHKLVRAGAITVSGDGCRLDELLEAFLPPRYAHLPPGDDVAA
jgi:hypothetical protein